MNTFEQMIERGHERVCFHHDPATGLRAIVAIHSTILGNALGGTRRWYYKSEADALEDVLRLSKGMTYKSAVAGLAIGGGKSVVLLPEFGHKATEAEGRAMGRFIDTFNGQYIAAEDVGVDPKFVDWMAMETSHVMGGDTISKGGDPSPFTALGIFHAMKAALTFTGKKPDFHGITVAIQGAGNVGKNLCHLLSKAGAKLIAADIIQENTDYVAKKYGAQIVPPEEILTTKCDILSPCALGGVINSNLARNLQCPIVCPGANNVLADPDEDAAMLKNAGVLFVPDFVANAGGLIRLAGLYLGISKDQLDKKIADIETTTLEILREAESKSSTYAAAVAVAHKRIDAGSKEQVHAG